MVGDVVVVALDAYMKVKGLFRTSVDIFTEDMEK